MSLNLKLYEENVDFWSPADFRMEILFFFAFFIHFKFFYPFKKENSLKEFNFFTFLL